MLKGSSSTVFDRYNIVSDADLRSAARMQAAYLEKISGENGAASTLAIFPEKNEKDVETAKCLQFLTFLTVAVQGLEPRTQGL